MTLAESLNSVELFAREVMPAFADGEAGVPAADQGTSRSAYLA
jgi:hypothetical protein